MIRLFRTGCFALSVLFFSVNLACAQQTMQHGAGHTMDHGNMAHGQAAPAAGMMAMHDDLMLQIAPLKREAMARKLELKAALLADEPDQKKIDALVAEINRINGEAFKASVAMQVNMAKMGMHDEIMKSGMHGMGSMGGMQGMGMMGGMKCGKMGGMKGMQHGGGMGGMKHGGGMKGGCKMMQMMGGHDMGEAAPHMPVSTEE